MYELSVAFKYLIPRWRQLSVSIISLISIFVIALVVWLIVVFFSVTQGLEKNWIQKLIALTAPVRISPTEHYYNSYYYLADSLSMDSNYTQKSIGEKLIARLTDPYNPDFDQEIPSHWPPPDLDSAGKLKDPVKLGFAAIQNVHGVQGLTGSEYEMTVTNIKLRLNRNKNGETHLSQATYLSSYDSENSNLNKAILSPTHEDVQNLTEIAWLDPSFHLDIQKSTPPSLPSHPQIGDAVLLPKSYRTSGVLIGDRGHLSYQSVAATSVQEQRLPIYVAGFYDPGILPLGGKIILANPYIITMIRASYPNDQSPLSNGINVRFDNLDDAQQVKNKLEKAFAQTGIDKYWNVETFREFDFTKDFLQQLRSERNLFTLISTIVILVACANIVSMLIILVNNKKMEIGILRSMGASSRSVAFIFGICGMVMGLAGSGIGLAAALITLKNLQALVDFISRLQGFDAFNPVFYGDALPNEMSIEVLVIVIGGTVLTSLIAGIIPAVKASLMRPSAILRSE